VSEDSQLVKTSQDKNHNKSRELLRLSKLNLKGKFYSSFETNFFN